MNQAFYDQFSPYYHLIFPDWEASIKRQAQSLHGLIQSHWPGRVEEILDVACGIGTQTLGLAQLGYTLTASDLSPGAIARARSEAAARGLEIAFEVADMREANPAQAQRFDLLIACDNSVPHLLCDAEILMAFEAFYAKLKPGGGCLITVRDYERESREGIQVKPYGVRVVEGVRYVLFQTWEFKGEIYDLKMYFVKDAGTGSGSGTGTGTDTSTGSEDLTTSVMSTQYYAVGLGKLCDLMVQAGFKQVQQFRDGYYQPVILGTRPA
ncbi:MAG: class I SAM-dependent methyltransferase [Candidatus Sericytochromatia bacterium]|nr:class I SAM-dependent methyltransferase [Candidatus Sericytochromatia bacterium]